MGQNATNDFVIVPDDSYEFEYQGADTTELRPNDYQIDENGHLIIKDSYYFPLSTIEQSSMDKDPNNTGPTNDFWTDYPITIDGSGYIFFGDENTGINVRGPAGISGISFDDLTEEQRALLIGPQGPQGRNGTNGTDGKSAFELWKEYFHRPDATIDDFIEYLTPDTPSSLIKGDTEKESIHIDFVDVKPGAQGNIANGAFSVALGDQTAANGSHSFTIGDHTISNYSNQTILGKYNDNQSDSIFEIGGGTADNNRYNIIRIASNGDIITTGEVIDKFNNKLSDKIDKDGQKVLTDVNFSVADKQKLDNLEIKNSSDYINSTGSYAVTGGAIYNYVTTAIGNINSKPNQALNNTDDDYSFLFAHDYSSNLLNQADYVNNFTWNPAAKILKTNATPYDEDLDESIQGFQNTIAIGEGLLYPPVTTVLDNLPVTSSQIILGQYNEPNQGDILQIGYGTSSSERVNYLTLTQNGDLRVYNDIIDGNNITLSSRQEQLTFDTEPTQNSTGVVNSGNLYTYLKEKGLDDAIGFSDPRVPSLIQNINALTIQVQQLQTLINTFPTPFEIQDDTYTNNIYTYGVDKGEFYIKLKEDESSEEDDDNENEGGDNIDDNNV